MLSAESQSETAVRVSGDALLENMSGVLISITEVH